MKHATPAALEGLSDLLEQIRKKDGIKEKKLGVFYRKSKAFLHFHEDPAGLFADLNVNVGADFERYPVNIEQEWTALLSAIDQALDLRRLSPHWSLPALNCRCCEGGTQGGESFLTGGAFDW